MKRRTVVWVVGVAAVAAAAGAWVYPQLPGGSGKARAEFDSLQERLGALHSLSGSLRQTGEPSFTGTATFRLLRPNYFFLDSPWRFAAGDGTTACLSDKKFCSYRRGLSPSSGMAISADLIGLESFATSTGTRVEPPFLSEPIGVRNAQFDGVACRDLEFKIQEASVTIHLFVDKSTELPRGFRVINPDVKLFPVVEGHYGNLRLDPVLPKESFAYTVPEGFADRTVSRPKMRDPGEPAPSFALQTPNGTTFHSSSKLTLLDFWFYGCAPCREEHQYLQELHRIYGDKVDIVSINHTDTPEVVKKYQEEEGFQYPIVLNGTGKNDLVTLLGVTMYPTNYLIKNGRVIGRIDGFSKEKLKAAIDAGLGTK